MRFGMIRLQAQSRLVMFARLRQLAALTQHIGQIDLAHRVAGMLGHSFGISGARRGAVSGFIQQRAEIVQRRPMRRFPRKQLEISVSGFGGAAHFGQQAGPFEPQRDRGGIGRDLRFQFPQPGFPQLARHPVSHSAGWA